MSSTVRSTEVTPPEQWPAEVVEKYQPIRTLGKGGFASVMLAKRKSPEGGRVDKLVAMKVVGGQDASKQEVGYAHREMDILRELSHPNIMRVVEVWEPPLEAHKCAAVMALSYAPGPTLEFLLKHIGAPSLAFSRVISAQLVDVVAYLHSHAVIHRDIKPDNLIVTGASLQDEEMYEDKDATDPDWKTLRKKWHLTLVDFGFARALIPDDAQVDVGLRNSMIVVASPPKLPRGFDSSLNEPLSDMSISRSRKSRAALDGSVSRKLVRKMSAVGNRMYAAPEIINGVRQRNPDDSIRGPARQSATLSNFVSDYGMVADAYSVGSTIRYILTGVPPSENVDSVIAAQNHPAKRAARWIGKRLSNKNKNEEKPRKKRYRGSNELPTEAVRLVRGMTHGDSKQRTTVRAARLYPWVDDVLEQSSGSHLRELKFLKCAMRDK